MSEKGIVTLMTDFGTADAYAAIMKGVMLRIEPGLRIVDISHEVPAFNIASSSYLLWTYYRWFPPGTVHCAVVDPGVGGVRDPVAVRFREWYFVLPDNGLISMLLSGAEAGEYEARRIENPEWIISPVSNTFHGRDLFAPAAAHIARGDAFPSAGPLIEKLTIHQPAAPRASGNQISGTVVHIDKFGNYITNITGEKLDMFEGALIFVRIGNFSIMGISRTYSDRPAGELTAYIGSSGTIEIGASKASALDLIGVPVGAEVIVRGKENR